MKLFCLHKYNQVDSEGYQYCTKCNKAVFIGLPECNHQWETIEKFSITDYFDIQTGILYVMQCKYCGTIMEDRVTI